MDRTANTAGRARLAYTHRKLPFESTRVLAEWIALGVFVFMPLGLELLPREPLDCNTLPVAFRPISVSAVALIFLLVTVEGDTTHDFVHGLTLNPCYGSALDALRNL